MRGAGRRRARGSRLLAGAASLAVACAAPPADAPPEELFRGLVELERRLARAVEARDPAAAAALCAEDAVLLLPGGEVAAGRRAIAEALELPEGVSVHDTRLEVLQVGGGERCAWMLGTYAYTVEEAGASAEVRGPFVVVFTRDAAGRWRVQARSRHVSAERPGAGGPAAERAGER